MDYKALLGYIATAIALSTYVIYLWSIYKGQTKPHAFTWFVFGTINVVAFAAVTIAGGAEGAWVLAVNVLGCYTIAGIGFYQRRVEYDRYDWLALLGALVGLFLWWQTKNPLYAVILVSISDSIGFIPSFRKAHKLPYEENLTSWTIGIFYYIFAILALESLTLTTWLYPAVVMVTDTAFVTLIIIRRKQIKAKQKAAL